MGQHQHYTGQTQHYTSTLVLYVVQAASLQRQHVVFGASTATQKFADEYNAADLP